MSRGILYVILASIIFGIVPLGNNYVLLSGMDPSCVLFYQALLMSFSCFIVLKLKKVSIRIDTKNTVSLLLLGAVGMGFTDYFLNLGMKQMQVSSVIMLHFLYPTIVLLISMAFFRQKLTGLTAVAVALSVLGLILVTDLSGTITPLGAAFAIGSAIAYALFVIANERGSFNRYNLILRLFYMSVGMGSVYGIKSVVSEVISLPASPDVWFVLVAIVGIISVLGFYFMTAGIKLLGASRAAFINMLEPVTAVIGGILFYHDIITVRSIIGCLCVLLSVLFIAMDGKHASAHVRLMKNQE